MDEPTAALSSRRGGAAVRGRRGAARPGAAVLFISHRLEEVFAICQRVTVMRDGKFVCTRRLGELDVDDHHPARWSAASMASVPRRPSSGAGRGRARGRPADAGEASSTTSASPSARARSSRWPVSWVPGAPRSRGRSSASTAATPGAVTRRWAPRCRDGRPAAAMAAGVGVRPRGPAAAGPGHGPGRLTTTSHSHRSAGCARPGFLRAAPSASWRPTGRRGCRSSTADCETRSATLSGGNQQKVVLGKWLGPAARRC